MALVDNVLSVLKNTIYMKICVKKEMSILIDVMHMELLQEVVKYNVYNAKINITMILYNKNVYKILIQFLDVLSMNIIQGPYNAFNVVMNMQDQRGKLVLKFLIKFQAVKQGNIKILLINISNVMNVNREKVWKLKLNHLMNVFKILVMAKLIILKIAKYIKNKMIK